MISSGIFVFVILLDQFTKFLASRFLPAVCNRGVAFGLDLGSLGILLVVGVILAVVYFLAKEKMPARRIAFVLIAGGGVSNLIDRLVGGCVVDFVDFKIWPSFNLADSAVTLGVIILVFGLFLTNKKIYDTKDG